MTTCYNFNSLMSLNLSITMWNSVQTLTVPLESIKELMLPRRLLPHAKHVNLFRVYSSQIPSSTNLRFIQFTEYFQHHQNDVRQILVTGHIHKIKYSLYSYWDGKRFCKTINLIKQLWNLLLMYLTLIAFKRRYNL